MKRSGMRTCSEKRDPAWEDENAPTYKFPLYFLMESAYDKTAASIGSGYAAAQYNCNINAGSNGA